MSNIKILMISALLLGTVGCFKDLNTIPIDPDLLTPENVYKDPAAYKQVLAKLYAGFAVSGQQGPAGQSDISGLDEGFGQYLRGFFYHQELTTDEAVIGWNDQSIKDFHAQNWTAGDGFIYAFYSRVFYQIALANEYIRETTDEKLDGRGVSETIKNEVHQYRAEARFLRALSYWHALDMFRNVPFATENDVVGDFTPKQATPLELFSYIESELKAIEPELAGARTNEYARADKAAAWMVLAKLYLNAEVYIQQNKYEDCLTYCEKILTAGFELEPTYQNLFLADNHKSKELIFPVAFDGFKTRTYGGTTFIIRAGIGGSMDPKDSGVDGGWGGCRATPQFIGKFPSDLTGIKVDFNPGATNYPKLYVPGSHQGNDATQTSNALAAPSTTAPNNKIYEGYKYFPDVNTEILFTTISSNTAPKYGDNGADGTLELGGAKIVVPTSGVHFLKVNLNTKTYSIEKRSWSIIGSATGGVDMDLSWDVEAGMPVFNGQLGVGTFKFRSNHDNTANFGDTGANGLLEQDGAEIVIDQEGSYKIFLDIDKPDYTYQIQLTSFDKRGLFYTDGQNLDINDLTVFTEGYAVNKFKNITSDGSATHDSYYADTDFPMFRLADVYLMASEAILRGAGGGDKTKAAQYFNAVRTRAFNGTSGNYAPNDLTLDVMLDERARELYWECHRRTDLVRFGQFTDGTYKWAWKGNVKDGAAVGKFRDVFPIPAADLNANSNLDQNPGGY